jgi:hypothetical protein
MAGIDSNTPASCPTTTPPFARGSRSPLRTTSIEAELRAVMAERREAEAQAAPKRRNRWS